MYERPFTTYRPAVCMDEEPVQLTEDTRDPIGAAPGRPKRMDYEYKRCGVVSVFLFSEPLKGWRRATARTQRRKLAMRMSESHAGVRQPQYAYQMHSLRTLRAGKHSLSGAAIGNCLNTEARQLAQCRGVRTERDDAPVLERPANRQLERFAPRSGSMGVANERSATRRRPAADGRRCEAKNQEHLSITYRLTEH